LPELGFWERSGKSPVLGALIGTTIIAALYSLAGNLVMSTYMIGDMLGNPEGLASKNWEEMRRLIMSRYRAPILGMNIAFEFLFFGLGTFILFRAWHGVPMRERFRLGPPKPAALTCAVIGAAGLLPLALLAGEVFERAFPFLRELEKSSESLVKASDPGSWALLVVAICVTPALCEEFLFRGYFQGTLCRGMASPWSWILTGSCFALVHQNYIGLGALLIIGISLAFVFDSSGSLWPGVLVHFLYNGAIILLANGTLALPWAFDDSGLVRPSIALGALPLAALGVGSLLLVKKKRLEAASPTSTSA
jgi:uncharacterized protein